MARKLTSSQLAQEIIKTRASDIVTLRKITVVNDPEPLQRGLKWSRRLGYQVRSDGGGMSTRIEQTDNLTEARKLAKQRAKQCGWADVFRWAESGVAYRKHFVARYDREMVA